MIFARSVEYAFRIMAYAALMAEERPIKTAEFAAEVNIPVFYLSKILRRMVVAGLLNSTKGHGGGFVLARPAHKIRFIQVLEAIEQKIGVRQCVFGWDVCSDKTPCVLHQRWSELNNTFQDWARKTTLADLKNDVATDKTLSETFNLLSKAKNKTIC